MIKCGFVSTDTRISSVGRRYLETLARDTWRCIDDMVHEKTGLPYDSSRRGENTSSSNIGLYLTDVVAAEEMGFISRKEARRRLSQTLQSVKKLEMSKGFSQCWNSVATLKPGTNDTWISLLDSGNMAAGPVVVGQAFPELRSECRQILDKQDWAAFYDQKRNLLVGGYDVAAGKFNPGWTVCLLGADSRLASFFAISHGGVPPASWNQLSRNLEERHHTKYLVPGWQGGGLFMQFINGLWLDDSDTLMGMSAENFAYAQIRHARAHDYPVWGWSASDSPGGKYVGWGALRDEIVTPHASVLAIERFPKAVLANLRKLEEMGARDDRFGFYDAIDVKTGEHSNSFLVLDQSMLFLSLVNFLRDGVVRKWFQADPDVQRARRMIADYNRTAYGDNVSVYTLDQLPSDIRRVDAPLPEPKKAVARPSGGQSRLEWRNMSVADSAEPASKGTGAGDLTARFAFEWTPEHLVFLMEVSDPSVVNNESSDRLHREDSVELFVDPKCDGLRWGDPSDFQFGFAVEDKSHEWFGERKLAGASVRHIDDGYSVRADIPWKMLGVDPREGLTVAVSPAVKSVDPEGSDSTKLNWNWQLQKGVLRLGKLVLE